MAKVVLRDCYIEVDGTNFSSHVSSVEVELKKDEINTTNFGGDGRERAAGLKDDMFTITFQQDYAANSVDAVLYPLWDLETEFTVKVRPTSAAKSANNPEYSATCILLDYQPLSGKVGELSDTKVKIHAQRTGITRATS
jgi:UTP:GlnB (protein PII) uridylyltransferase